MVQQNVRVVSVYHRNTGVILSEFSFLQFQRSIHVPITQQNVRVVSVYWRYTGVILSETSFYNFRGSFMSLWHKKM